MALIEIPEMDEVRQEIKVIKTYVRLIACMGGKHTVNVSDVARWEGVSVSTLRKGGVNRFLLPRYGESGYPTGSVRWDAMEFAEWSCQPPEERRAGYLEHLRQQTKRKRKGGA